MTMLLQLHDTPGTSPGEEKGRRTRVHRPLINFYPKSGGRCDLGLTFLGARTTGPATRRTRCLFRTTVDHRNGRRQAFERNALLTTLPGIGIGHSLALFVATTALTTRAQFPALVIVGARLTIGTLLTIGPGFAIELWLTIPARFTLAARLTLGTFAARCRSSLTLVLILAFALIAGEDLVLILILVIGEIVAAAALLLEPGAAFAQHPEVMIGKLQIIFGLHTVTGQLCVAGKRLVFLVKLDRIAARPVILPVAGAGRIVGRTCAATTAPTAVLTIVDQTMFLVTGGLSMPLHSPGPSRQSSARPPGGGSRKCAARLLTPGSP